MLDNGVRFNRIASMKQKLPKDLQALFDFYRKQRQNLPDIYR